MTRIIAVCLALIGLVVAGPLLACKPLLPSPHSDALLSDAVFVGVVVATEPDKPAVTSGGDFSGSRAIVTISRNEALKGDVPPSVKVHVSSACGGFLPLLHQRVVVIRSGSNDYVRPSTGYERLVRQALQHGG